MRNLAQLDGNISLSDSEDDTFRDLYRPLIVDTAASPPPAAPEGPEGDVFQNSLQRLLDGIRAGPTLQSSTALDPDQGSDHSKDDLITLTPRPNLGDLPSNQQSTRDDDLYGAQCLPVCSAGAMRLSGQDHQYIQVNNYNG